MDYKRKYLKYKLKYLLLNNKKLGGLNTVPAIESNIFNFFDYIKNLFKSSDNENSDEGRNLLNLEELNDDIEKINYRMNRRQKTPTLLPNSIERDKNLDELYLDDTGSDITDSIGSYISSDEG